MPQTHNKTRFLERRRRTKIHPPPLYDSADGSGLMYWANDYTFGVTNSLFSKCHSDLRAGALFFAINKNPFNHIVRFCFFSENTAQKGRNALVHFNGSSTTHWSQVFFHSFTSDTSLTNSLVQTFDAADPVTVNWLPLTNRNADALECVHTHNSFVPHENAYACRLHRQVRKEGNNCYDLNE